jgi:hypothetical protein
VLVGGTECHCTPLGISAAATYQSNACPALPPSHRCSPGKLNHFHTIGFGPDSFVWLRKMAAAVPGGQFHDHAPKHGQALSYAALLTTFRSISSGVTASRSGSGATSGHYQQQSVCNLITRPASAWRWDNIWGDLYVCK